MAELRGRRAICESEKRTWKTIMGLWEKQKFPMNKIGGVWVTDTDLTKEWRLNLLRRR